MDFQTESAQALPQQQQQKYTHESQVNMTDKLLEDEKQTNQKDNWNKLDKTTKLQLLTSYADTYGAEKNLSSEDITGLKRFFRDAVEKGKFQKAKDIVYNKATREIQEIPSLHWNSITNNFTLRNMDTKKVSLLKSLTPKRVTAKNNAPVKLHIKDEDENENVVNE